MTREAQICFHVADEQIKTYVQETPGEFVPVFIEHQLQVIVKEVAKKKQTYDKVRMLAGAMARTLTKQKVAKATLKTNELSQAFSRLEREQLIIAFVEGWELGNYQFQAYKSNKQVGVTELRFREEAEVAELVQTGKHRAEATKIARDLMNEIPSVLTPETFPQKIKEIFENSAVEVIVHDKNALEEMKMNGILAVNRGSKHDPTMIELYYKGDATKPLIALVGKGVTFDTGGISLKNARDLSDMRMDMGGAAAVVGAVKLLAALKAPVNVVGLIQTVENMPDRHSLLPGDVITYKNGKTVQVGNTDAEGRLILADGLIRADELKADYVVDIATLTGAIMVALGTNVAGIFGDEALMQTMKKLGEQNGEFVWPMPLIDDYEKTLKSDYADFSNISNSRYAGSITAALFLRKFVTHPDRWVHIDLGGVMERKEEGYYSNQGSGFGARLLADFALEISQ